MLNLTHYNIYTSSIKRPCSILALYKNEAKKLLKNANKALKENIKICNFNYDIGDYIALYHDDSYEHDYVFIIDTTPNITYDAIAATITPSDYTIICSYGDERMQALHIAQYYHLYAFSHCKKQQTIQKKYKASSPLKTHSIATITMTYLTRDLINYPPNYMTPSNFAAIAASIAARHHAACTIIDDDDIVKSEFPLLHAVGRASVEKPCVIDISWGDDAHPTLVLVGKAVCFDSGGLDIKPASGMQLMKKDMGGGAHALALAHAIMQCNLPIKVRCLIGAVENVISGSAFKPSDIIQARNKTYVEIGDTDAEGRLVLADLMDYASQYNPQLLIDFATLTGAARVALGTKIAASFTNKQHYRTSLEKIAQTMHDPMWFLPLFEPYKTMLNSPVADISSTGKSGYGGAITAALFLQYFIPQYHNKPVDWIHLDIMAWNIAASPGYPEGGEAYALRALLHYLTHQWLH